MLLHVGYQFALLFSYRVGDLTQVYPIARGVAPILVAGVSVMVLGVSLSVLELTAIAIIGAGIISLGLVRQNNGLHNWSFTRAPIALVSALRETSIVFALAIGVLFLKERIDAGKVLATMTTILGTALLRLSKSE